MTSKVYIQEAEEFKSYSKRLGGGQKQFMHPRTTHLQRGEFYAINSKIRGQFSK